VDYDAIAGPLMNGVVRGFDAITVFLEKKERFALLTRKNLVSRS